MNVTARNVAATVGIGAAVVAGIRGYQDATDNEPDSINGYVGYGLLASVAAEMIGTSVVGGTVGRGIAGAGIFSAVLGGGAVGALLGTALNND